MRLKRSSGNDGDGRFALRSLEKLRILGAGTVLFLSSVFEFQVKFEGDFRCVELFAVVALGKRGITLLVLEISLSQRRCFLWRAATASFSSAICASREMHSSSCCWKSTYCRRASRWYSTDDIPV